MRAAGVVVRRMAAREGVAMAVLAERSCGRVTSERTCASRAVSSAGLRGCRGGVVRRWRDWGVLAPAARPRWLVQLEGAVRVWVRGDARRASRAWRTRRRMRRVRKVRRQRADEALLPGACAAAGSTEKRASRAAARVGARRRRLRRERTSRSHRRVPRHRRPSRRHRSPRALRGVDLRHRGGRWRGSLCGLVGASGEMTPRRCDDDAGRARLALAV